MQSHSDYHKKLNELIQKEILDRTFVYNVTNSVGNIPDHINVANELKKLRTDKVTSDNAITSLHDFVTRFYPVIIPFVELLRNISTQPNPNDPSSKDEEGELLEPWKSFDKLFTDVLMFTWARWTACIESETLDPAKAKSLRRLSDRYAIASLREIFIYEVYLQIDQISVQTDEPMIIQGFKYRTFDEAITNATKINGCYKETYTVIESLRKKMKAFKLHTRAFGLSIQPEEMAQSFGGLKLPSEISNDFESFAIHKYIKQFSEVGETSEECSYSQITIQLRHKSDDCDDWNDSQHGLSDLDLSKPLIACGKSHQNGEIDEIQERQFEDGTTRFLITIKDHKAQTHNSARVRIPNRILDQKHSISHGKRSTESFSPEIYINTKCKILAIVRKNQECNNVFLPTPEFLPSQDDTVWFGLKMTIDKLSLYRQDIMRKEDVLSLHKYDEELDTAFAIQTQVKKSMLLNQSQQSVD